MTTHDIGTTSMIDHEAAVLAAYRTIERMTTRAGAVPAEWPPVIHVAGVEFGQRDNIRGAYSELRDEVRDVVQGSTSPVVPEILDALLELDRRIEADAGAGDPNWDVREAADQVKDLLDVFVEEDGRSAVQDPAMAVQTTLDLLRDVGQADLARLFDVDVRTVRNWQTATPRVIRKHPARAVLVGEVVYLVSRTATPRGVVQWFNREREVLDGRTPQALMDEDIDRARELILSLAQASRGQLAS